MGKMQRAKGAQGEREVVRRFADFGIEAVRTAPMQAGHSTHSPDVQITPLPHWWTEVKRMKRVPVGSSFRQAVDDCEAHEGSTVPLLVHREDRGEWLATMRFADVLSLVSHALGVRATSHCLPPSVSSPSSHGSRGGDRGNHQG